MIKLYLVLAVPTLLLVAYVMFNLGMDWINFNYGLNPFIAFPITVIALFTALACYVSINHVS